MNTHVPLFGCCGSRVHKCLWDLMRHEPEISIAECCFTVSDHVRTLLCAPAASVQAAKKGRTNVRRKSDSTRREILLNGWIARLIYHQRLRVEIRVSRSNEWKLYASRPESCLNLKKVKSSVD
jgi:hypothetical protein